MISHPWRGLLRINKATFNNNSLASWRADLDLHPGRAAREDWRVVHRDQLLQLLLYLHRGRQLQSWACFGEAVRFPSPIPESVRVCQWQATGRWRGKRREKEAIVLHQIVLLTPTPHHRFCFVLFHGLLIFIKAFLLCLHFSIMLAGLIPTCLNTMQTSWNQILLARFHQMPSATQHLSPHSC